jgi:hypothetical protein
VRKLTVADIADLRAYERERAELRERIIELKRTRRVALGPILTVLFENTETMRWQVQEMARAERMLRDEQIAHEVATYNDLIPDMGELSGTLFLELTSDAALREWLPKLVGIEFHVGFELPGGAVVYGKPSDADEERLTRDDTTAAVHYLRFAFSPEQVAAFETGPVHVIVDHPEYSHRATLDAVQHASLVADLLDLT